MEQLAESDFILNADESIYHLNLLPEDLANTIITVGDPDRVAEVSKYFDHIELKKGKREFITHTGYIGSRRITVISTGIGTDNIDIVLNELDALVNVDFKTRTVKSELTSLNIIRIGTSGAIQDDIEMGTILASSYGLGLDALMNYYPHQIDESQHSLNAAVEAHFETYMGLKPYINSAGTKLLNTIAEKLEKGITVTAPGFYGPQGRNLRAKNSIPDLIKQLNKFQFDGLRITNLEMETAGIYALAKSLGHQALSINAILASRVNRKFSKEPNLVVKKAIETVLEQL